VCYINEAKIKRNSENHVVLPSGTYVPHTIPGLYLCDHIDKWHCHYPNQTTTAQITSNADTTGQMMYGISATTTPVAVPSVPAATSTFQLSTNNHIAALE